nr:glycoside hydrolase family 55 protein [Pirellulaceae bacterium]
MKKLPHLRITTLALLAAAWLGAPPAFAQTAIQYYDTAEEFAGPFPSWKNVKTDYGAVGDGTADDTAAIQKALDALQFHKDFCVLYFPAGTYRITNTVSTARKAHHDGMGMAVVGEDPATTILRWDGPEGVTMVKYDAWYSKISRLTLDGAGKAGNALAYGDAFSTYNETSDMVFRDVKWGMTMGTANDGQAENGVLRCRFLRCSEGGLRTVNFNSMDIWIWDSIFEDCGYGVFNQAGNFHVYHSLFLRSRKTDIGSANLMAFSFVDNVSIGSQSFLDWAGGHSWGSPTTISGNRIVDYIGDYAIRLGNFGPYLLLDNQIRSRPGEASPPIRLTWGDQSLVGNVCTVAKPVQPVMKDGKVVGRFLEIGARVIAPEEIDATPPALAATPKLVRRPVFDVPASADAAAIQAAIDQAAAKKGERPVVHLPQGIYKIKAPLVIPAGCDVRLVGDGGAETATVLRWEGPAGGALLRLAGPSRATVRDLAISAGAGIGILVEDADQKGGRVFGDMVNVAGGQGLFVNGLARTRVLLRNQQGGECQASWIRVADGRPGAPPVTVLCGATGSSRRQYIVEKGGRLVVRSVYHEVSGDAPEAILLDDEGSLAVDATRFSYKASPEHPTVAIEGFRGEFLVTSGM